ncbi:MAG TPA: glycosyltransferase family 1 protein [Candidatus Dormibacteraeota bacterium]
MTRFAIDLTACWRPRVGMVTLALELTAALIERGQAADFTLLCSRERPAGFEAPPAVLSPHRHEVANKLLWLPAVEPQLEAGAILYPYWPSPPRRRRGAPPAVVFVHDLAFRLRPGEVPWQQRAYLGYVLPRSLSQAAAIVVPSRATRDDLLAAYRLAEDRVHVVPEAPARMGDEPGALPAGVQPPFLLSVATIEPRKNYPRLVGAYRRLRDELPDAPDLVVVGRTGWAYGNALELLRETPGVRLLGHVDDSTLLALYRSATALVFPSLYEGFGLPLVEAMREGLPALIGERGALPEVAAGAALEVDAEDADAIAAGMRRLIDDAALRRRLAGEGRARAAGFSWERSGAAVEEILRSVAATGSATIAS